MGWIENNISPEVADYVFNLKINLPDRVGVYQRNVKADLIIDFDNLESQLSETQEMVCFFDVMLAEQKAVVAHYEHKARLVRGTITDTISNKWKELNREIRSTDLKQIIESDPEIVNIQARINKETLAENKLKAVIEGLRMKSDHLRSLAGFKRDERRNP